METSPKVAIIKNIYLYLVSFVALMMVIFSTADIINIVLRTYVFTKADKNFYSYPEPACTPPTATDTPRGKELGPPCVNEEIRKKQETDNMSAQRERDLVRDISFILVGIPLFLYHWGVVRRKE